MAAIAVVLLLYSTLMPWRWIWRLGILGSMLGLLLGLLVGAPETGAGNAAMSFGPLLVLLAAALILALRLMLAATRAIRRRDCPTGAGQVFPDQPLIRLLDVILQATASVLAGLIGADMMVLEDLGIGYPSHVLGIALSVVGLVFLTGGRLFGRDPARWRRRLLMLSIALGVAAASLCASALYPLLVMRQAIAIAGNDPYCIAMNISRRPVLSVQDMTYFGFDKGGLKHHAILLVDRDGGSEPYHWSYRKSAFEPGAWFWQEGRDNLSRIACRPERNFVERLPLIRWPRMGYGLHYAEGRLLEIPTAYEPEIFLGDITIGAIAPDFRAAEDHQDDDRVLARPIDRIWLESIADDAFARPPTGRIDSLSEVRMAEHDGVIYYRLDDRGEARIVVICHDDRPRIADCRHRFDHDGRVYSFEHGRHLIDRSTDMQQALVDLFASFEVER